MIAIIGAGPAGSYAAYLLSKKYDVSVFEEHKDIGLPVQCTGITAALLKNIVPLKKRVVVNEVRKARIFSPNKKFVEVNLKEKNLIIDRHKFDNQLADMAKQRGAEFFLNHKFIDNKDSTAVIKNKKNNQIKKVNFTHLIGADGPLSSIAKSNSMFSKRKFWQGVQARVKIKNDNIVEFYPYFGTYAWLVPENKDTARVGLVADNYADVLFKNFIYKFKGIKQKDIIEHQGGLIPKYDPKIKTQKNNIYIAGDAACQVKATTGGGVIQSLLASKALANSIINNKNYSRQWRKSIGRELYLHLKARNIMDKFKDKDWNKLIYMINSKETKKVLENNDREDIFSILLKLLIKKPGLLYFGKYVI